MNSVHLIRTDVLLLSLGGFAEPPREMPNDRFLPVGYVRELKRLAEKRRCSHGEVKELADRYGRPVGAATTAIYYQRRNNAPGWWDEVAT